MPGQLPPKRPRTRAEKRDTYRSIVLIGLAVHGMGIVGSLLALGLALRTTPPELLVANPNVTSPPLSFILVLLAVYVCFAAVHAVVMRYIREKRARPALTIMSIGGFVLTVGVLFSGVLFFGSQFFIWGALYAYHLPYFFVPLLIGVPVTAAAAVISVRQVRSIGKTTAKDQPSSASPRLLR